MIGIGFVGRWHILSDGLASGIEEEFVMRRSKIGQLVTRIAISMVILLALLFPLAEVSWAVSAPEGPQYPGLKKRIAVLDFEVKAPKAPRNLGSGMAEMLITALHQTGRFIVLERQAIEDILKEQRLGMSGAVKSETEAQVVEILGAQVLVKGAITELDEKSEGGGLALPFGGVKGGLTIGKVTGHVAIDVRMFDANTGVILDSHRSEATVSEAALGLVLAGGKIDLGAVGFQKTPLGKAIRQAIDESVSFIVRKMEAIPWQGRVVLSEGGKVYVNAGRELGLPPGCYLEVYKRGKELIDPDTGLSLGFQITKIGLIQAEQVEDKFSICRLVGGSPGSKGDIVKLIPAEQAQMVLAELGRVPGEAAVGPGKFAGGTIGAAGERGIPSMSIVVVIPERHIQRQIPDPAGETEIIRKLVENGFNVVDQKKVNEIRYSELVFTALKDARAAISIGRDFGADIAIIGEAFSEFAGRMPSNMISCRARVEARVIDMNTGRILAADGREASAMDISENVAAKKALRQAGSELADYFIECLKSRSQVSEGVTTRRIELLLTGIESYRQLIEFERVLKGLPGVMDVQRRSFSERMARFDVTASIEPMQLADEIYLHKFDSFQIEIGSFTESKLEVMILPAASSSTATPCEARTHLPLTQVRASNRVRGRPFTPFRACSFLRVWRQVGMSIIRQKVGVSLPGLILYK